MPALWADLQTLRSLSFTYPEQKSTIEAYLLELESGNNPERRPPSVDGQVLRERDRQSQK